MAIDSEPSSIARRETDSGRLRVRPGVMADFGNDADGGNVCFETLDAPQPVQDALSVTPVTSN